MTTTFPNVAQLTPLGRIVSGLIARINTTLRAAIDRYGFALVDLYTAASVRDPEMRTIDRFHASTGGHLRFAAAAAEAINLPGSNHDWAKASSNSVRPSFAARGYAQLRWMQGLFLPWFWRRLRGYSLAPGRVPKRPQLERVGARCEDVSACAPRA
ncbi:SGNH/GDSL hydrolase family protein [Mycobacterium lacus]|uniref:hypothetical protein n=1 Tax=Mycobacterium lacus TaxID=169765 RepID=UPI001E30607F|nr:hypothetical protein [Mycobacterium lacus]